jgi:hypothetical protein
METVTTKTIDKLVNKINNNLIHNILIKLGCYKIKKTENKVTITTIAGESMQSFSDSGKFFGSKTSLTELMQKYFLKN